MKCVHYGAIQFNPTLFAPIQNRRWANKPLGGLWASDVNAAYGWKKFCKDAGFRIKKTNDRIRFFFELNTDRILLIDSSEKACELPQRRKQESELGIEVTYPVLPDFETIATQYDAIDFRISSDPSLYRTLYSWDCDSILVMNPNVINVA